MYFTKVFSPTAPREDSIFLYFFNNYFLVLDLHVESISQRQDPKEGRNTPWWSSINLNLAILHLSTAQREA